jgi:hypothetical protein
LLIGAAIVVGLVLLSQGFKSDNTASRGNPGTTTHTSTTTHATATTVVQPHDAAQVKVLVLNGVNKAGIAKAAGDQLKAANYTVLPGANANGGPYDTSTVYFVAGFDADAQTIAAKLGLTPAAAQPLPSPPPASVADPADANVIVIIGKDAPVAGGQGAASTATTAPTTTAPN